MKTNSDRVSIRIDCVCNAEILDITYWKDDNPRMYFFTMYKSCFGRDLLWRLKQAWKYFRNGGFEGNSIAITEHDYNKFVDVLTEHKPKIGEV